MTKTKSNQILLLASFCLVSNSVSAESTAEIICTYAPSQSETITNFTAVAGGAGATAYAITQATGLTAVAHSSGALIFTGSGGYVAGTLGSAAIAPFIIGVGVVIGSVAGTVELLCSPKNHKDFTDKVKDASFEYVRRSKIHLNKVSSNTSATYDRASLKAKPVINEVTIVLKDNANKVFDYAYRTVINSEIESPHPANNSKN